MVSSILAALLFPWTADATLFRPVKNARETTDLHADITRSFLTHSNLGGAGPDSGSEQVHILGLVATDDERTDLVITADSLYRSQQPLENGLAHDFGLINFQCNTSAKLWFQFVDSETHVLRHYSKIYMTLYDFDQSSDGMFEEATINGATAIWVSDTTELISNMSSKGGSWRSSTHGTSKDNPRDKEHMTKEQRDRALTVLFENTGEFEITLAVMPDAGGCQPYGRTFLYDFRPALVNETMVRPTEWPSIQSTGPGALFHMERSSLHRNNLGGMGPLTDGLRGIIFKNAGFFDGSNINFAASVANGTYEPYSSESNGFWDGWGKINGQCGSELDLRFSFLNEYDGFPMTIPEVLFSFTGIGSDTDGGCAVSVSMSNFENYSLVDTEVNVSETSGLTTFSKAFTQTDATSQVDLVFKDVHAARATIKWDVGSSGGKDFLFKIGNVL
eukprot:TRINITY_DN275_c0_g1_i2.p1 TRINITY_DN275_c0_g1~~TRINITY_DN275_c0_g1_i2.p1  ORF type:complete len:446 (-),score=47.20 TRINITY_DN275_c0_g1_i2:360-1697(-)